MSRSPLVLQAKANLQNLFLMRDYEGDRKALIEMAYVNESEIVRLVGAITGHIGTARRSISDLESALETHGVFNACGPLQNEQRNINVATAELNVALKARQVYVHIFQDGGGA